MTILLSKEDIVASMRFANCRKWQLDPQETDSHVYVCQSVEDDPESDDLYWKTGFIEEEWTDEMTDYDKECYFNIRVSGLRGYWKRDCSCGDWVVEPFKPFDGGDFPSVFQFLVSKKGDATALSFLDLVKDLKEFQTAVRYGLEAYDYLLKVSESSVSQELTDRLKKEPEIILFGEQCAERYEQNTPEQNTKLVPTNPRLTFDDLEYLWALFIGIYPEFVQVQKLLYGHPRTPNDLGEQDDQDDDVMSVSSKSSESSYDSDCSENTKELLRKYSKDIRMK